MIVPVTAFYGQVRNYDPAPGRARLQEDLEKLLKHARTHVEAGRVTEGLVLARVALRYYRALHPPKRVSGP